LENHTGSDQARRTRRENVHPAEKNKKKKHHHQLHLPTTPSQEPEAAERGIGNKKRDEEKVKEARNQQTKLSITISISFPSTRGEKGKKLEEQ
jgi:hypothetical protein